MRTSDFDYDLPRGLIAQAPMEPRDHSRLMVVSRNDGSVRHRHFFDLPEYLRDGDLLVFNDSRVLPARLNATRTDTGGAVEVLLLHRVSPGMWRALVRPGRRMREGAALARIHRCGAALGLEQGVRAVGRDGPRSIPIDGASGGLWLSLGAPMAVLGSGAGAGSAGQHAGEDNRGPGRCDSVGWLGSLVDGSGAVGVVRQAMAGLAIERGRD